MNASPSDKVFFHPGEGLEQKINPKVSQGAARCRAGGDAPGRACWRDRAEQGKPSCLRTAVWLDVADAVPVPSALKAPETSP